MATTLYLVHQDQTRPQLQRALGVQVTNLASDSAGVICYQLNTSRGDGVIEVTRTSEAGPTSGIEVGDDDGSRFVAWVSAPLAAGATISGTITLNLWCRESNTSANASVNARIWRLQPDDTLTEILKTARTTEMGTATNGAAANFTGSPTSTAFAKGDRILVAVFFDDAASSMASGYTLSLFYNGTTASASGDTYVTFNENLTFTTSVSGTTFYLTPTLATIAPNGSSYRAMKALTARASTAAAFGQVLGSVANSSVGQTTTVISMSKAVTAGDVIVVGWGCRDDITSDYCSDSGSAALYTQVERVRNATTETSEIYIATVIRSGILTSITITHPSTRYVSAYAVQLTGVMEAGYAAGSGSTGNGKTGTWVANKAIPANGIAIGAVVAAPDSPAVNATAGAASGSPSTTITMAGSTDGSTGRAISLAYAIAGSSDVTSFSGTTVHAVTNNVQWAGAGVILKPAATGALTTPLGWAPPVQWTSIETGGKYLEWFTPPLDAFTLADAIKVTASLATYNFGGFWRPEVAVCNGDGTSPTVWAAHVDPSYVGEDGDQYSIFLAAPDASVASGKRLRLRLYCDDAEVAMTDDGSPLFVAFYGAGASGFGESLFQLAQTVTTQSDEPVGTPGITMVRHGVV